MLGGASEIGCASRGTSSIGAAQPHAIAITQQTTRSTHDATDAARRIFSRVE